MIRTSIRLRLILAFSAMVVLLLFVGLASYLIHDQVVQQVQDVRRGASYDLYTHDSERTGLEITGHWNPAGVFMAEDIEPKDRQDPRLRGPIQFVDAGASVIRLYGLDVHITPQTRYGEDEFEDRPVRTRNFRVGQRVEVKCEVVAGRWEASKIYVAEVNPTDKIKGMVTEKKLDGVPPESIFIHDLEIVVVPVERGSTQSALARIEQANRMIKEQHSLLSAAYGLVGVLESGAGLPERMAAASRLAECGSRFADIVRQGFGEGGDRYSKPKDAFVDRLEIIQSLYEEQRPTVAALLTLSERADASGQAHQLVYGRLDKFIVDQMMPQLLTYFWEGDEELGDQLRALQERTRLTPNLALGVSVVAALLAFVLGFLVWRSIHGPIQRVKNAAVRLGQGNLDTRIAVDSDDEIGVLAQAFNTMAGRLASTTVSMASLERVFDSMAAALLLLDSAGRISTVNRAACQLLRRSRDEMVGAELDLVCCFEPGEKVGPIVTVGRAGGGQDIHRSVERRFRRSDGVEVPVALSGAELRSGDGPRQGFVCVAQDLTEQKRIQHALQQSVADKELLLREVHHRVKNNMQVITSLLAMQSSDGDPEVERRLQESQHRIRTIALIHEQLYLSPELTNIDLKSYLSVLCEQLMHSFGADGRVTLDLQIEDLGLDVDQSLSIGLIINELVTNAMKYAFGNDRAGKLSIHLFANPDGSRTLEVKDDGPGFDQASVTGRDTLGTSLIKTIARQLRGRVEVDGNNGTRTTIVFGLSRRKEAAVS